MRAAIEAAASHPVSVFMAAAAILLFGTVSVFHLRIELLPSLEVPLVRIQASYPGIPPEESERLLTIPLENALSSVKGLKAIESVTKEDQVSVFLRFGWNREVKTLLVEVREKIDEAYPYLPYGIQKPLVQTEDLGSDPILTLTAFPAEGSSLSGISSLVEKELSARLGGIPGVSSVLISGARGKEVRVEAAADKLESAGLTILDLSSILSSSIFDLPVGTVTEGDFDFLVKAVTKVNSSEAVKRVPCPLGRGILRIGDIAEVRDASVDASSFFRLNGREGIGIRISKMPDAGSLNTALQVLSELPALQALYKRDFSLELVSDGTEEIRSCFFSLLGALGLGTAAAFLVLLLSFRTPLAPLVVSASVPVSICFVFLFLYSASFTLNIVSLTGIAVGIGMIVDNSIVVLTSLRQNKARSPQEIADAVLDVASAAFASTITSIIVFFPILFLPGMLGALFSELALTLIVLLAASYLSSLFLTPALYAAVLPHFDKRPVAGCRKTRVTSLYRRYLYFSFCRPAFPFGLLLLMAALGTVSFHILPKRIMPKRDPGRIEILISFAPGTRLEASSENCRRLSQTLLSIPGIDRIAAEGGSSESICGDTGFGMKNPWTAKLTVFLAAENNAEDGSAAMNAEKACRLLAEKLSPHSGFSFSMRIPPDTISRLMDAGPEHVFRMTGENREDLLERAGKLMAELREANLVSSLSLNTRRDLPQLHFISDDKALAEANMTQKDVLDCLAASVRGLVSAKLPGGEEDLDIRVMVEKSQTQSAGGLSALKVRGEKGSIPIGLLGSFRTEYSYPELHRTGRKVSLDLTFTPLTDSPSSSRKTEKVLSAYPEGLRISAESVKDGARHAGLVFTLAVLLMYLVLGAQFESFLIPLILLLSFPLSAAGSFLFLLFYGYSLNLNSVLGILILLGTTINSSILLTSSYRGKDTGGIIQASLTRLGPLGATVNTTLLALLPLLIFTRGERVLQSATAVALAGGLLVGTPAILLVYPALFQVLKRR